MSCTRIAGWTVGLLFFTCARPLLAQHCTAWEVLSGPHLNMVKADGKNLFQLAVQVPVDDPGWKTAPQRATLGWMDKAPSAGGALLYFQTIVVCPDRAGLTCRLRVSGVVGRLQVRLSSKQYSQTQVLATITDGKTHVVDLTAHVTRSGFSRLLLVHISDGRPGAVPLAQVEFDDAPASLKDVDMGWVAVRIKACDKTPIHYESIADPPLVLLTSTAGKPKSQSTSTYSTVGPSYPASWGYPSSTVWPYYYSPVTTYQYYTVPTYTYRTVYYYYYTD
jgi:hypothetical protein